MSWPRPNLTHEQLALAQSLLRSSFGNSPRTTLSNINLVDKPFPAQALYHFANFMFDGRLPTGNATALPRITEDEVQLLNKPYSTWAPAPHDQLPSSYTESILECIEREETLTLWPRRVLALKNRLLSGMVPISGNRWKEKRLDDPKNIGRAIEFMREVVGAICHLEETNVYLRLQTAFNLIFAEVARFQNALNARRAQQGAKPLNLTGLWVEYVEALFTVMVTRTHSWVAARCDELLEKLKENYEASTSGGQDAALAESKSFVTGCQALNGVVMNADFIVAMPMSGFEGYQAPDTHLNASIEDRKILYDALKTSLPWPVLKKFHDGKNAAGEPGYGEFGFKSRQACLDFYREQEEGRKQIQLEFRGPPPKIGEEHWITVLKSRQDWSISHGGPENQRWGFVAYRLSYKESPAEWQQFRDKLDTEFKRSGEWIDGADDIRDCAGLQWIDGREVGIPENDIAAAKRHFAVFRNTDSRLRRMSQFDFLVADVECVRSYAQQVNQPQQVPVAASGDYGGYLKLVDGMYETLDLALIAQVAPGYTGVVKVLGSLVFDDVYPLLASLTQRPADFWALAAGHPKQVYTGPTVPSQEAEWAQTRNLQDSLLGGFLQFLQTAS